MQAGLLDWQTRFEQLDKGGDPLVKLACWFGRSRHGCGNVANLAAKPR